MKKKTYKAILKHFQGDRELVRLWWKLPNAAYYNVAPCNVDPKLIETSVREYLKDDI